LVICNFHLMFVFYFIKSSLSLTKHFLVNNPGCKTVILDLFYFILGSLKKDFREFSNTVRQQFKKQIKHKNTYKITYIRTHI